LLDFITICFGAGFAIAYATGNVTAHGFRLEFHLEGPLVAVFVGVVALYFFAGRNYLGGTLWQRVLRARRTHERRSLSELAVVVAILVVALASTTLFPSRADWQAAYDRGDYEAALRIVRPLAEGGDAAAQNVLGSMYSFGRAVPRDDVEAARWYRAAAEQGYAPAQYNLGVSYSEGRGLPRDRVEAARWYRKAAEQGEALAQNNLGSMYLHGDGVPRDDGEAVRWYRAAAAQRIPIAQYNLGGMYARGNGVPHDDVEAVRWYRAAAEQGYPLAQFYLAGMYYRGDGVRRDYAEAVRLVRAAAEQGEALAQANLGFLYAEGRIVPQDFTQAYMWSEIAMSGAPDAEVREQVASTRERIGTQMSPVDVAEAQRLAREWSAAHPR
jgi:TPR repeat protein